MHTPADEDPDDVSVAAAGREVQRGTDALGWLLRWIICTYGGEWPRGFVRKKA